MEHCKMGKSGTHRSFTVPKKFIDNGVLDPDKTYTVTITEEKPAEAAS